MIWLLLLHIIALLMWGAGILYIPVMLAGASRADDEFESSSGSHDSAARFVFSYIATPAALVAIVSGAMAFLFNQVSEFWFIAKLTLVSSVVLIHALLWVLIRRAECKQYKHLRLMSGLASVVLMLLMTTVIWLALAKTQLSEMMPWT